MLEIRINLPAMPVEGAFSNREGIVKDINEESGNVLIQFPNGDSISVCHDLMLMK